MKDELIKVLLKNISIEGIAVDTLDLVLEPALHKVVMDTENPFDDMLMATVYPILEIELKKLIKEKLGELTAKLTEEVAVEVAVEVAE